MKIQKYSSLKQNKMNQEIAHQREILKLKERVEADKEELKTQFKKYCEEIKIIYDRDKDKLKNRISELTHDLSIIEKDKEVKS